MRGWAVTVTHATADQLKLISRRCFWRLWWREIDPSRLARFLAGIKPLEMFGWLKPDDPIMPRAWQVDPRVHEKFAERAERERERRERVRKLVFQASWERENV